MSALEEIQGAVAAAAGTASASVVRVGRHGGRGAGVVIAEDKVLTSAHNLLILLYLLALTMEAAAPGPLPERLWQELGSLGVHGLLADVLHEGVPEAFRALLGRSEFGEWALAI